MFLLYLKKDSNAYIYNIHIDSVTCMYYFMAVFKFICALCLFLNLFKYKMKLLMIFLIFQRNLRHNLPFGRNQLSPRRSHDARRYCRWGRTLGWRSNGLCQRDDPPTWSRNRSRTYWQRWKLHWLVFCRQYKYQVRIESLGFIFTLT